MAQALHTSPFDPKISDLTQPQMMWILLNHHKDKEEQFELVKLLCRFINPEGAKAAFDKDEIISEVTDDSFLEEIKKHAKGNVSKTDLVHKMSNLSEGFSEPDTIERVD